MYALIKNGLVEKYPYSVAELRKDNPSVSFPATPSDADMETYGVFHVQEVARPEVDYTQNVSEGVPELQAGQWTQVWVVSGASDEELAQRLSDLQNSIVQQTQQRLDDFARTRGYDGILSACTYATSPTDKFQMEGQYCVIARDSTWAKLYAMLLEVQAGTRPVPTSYTDIEAELPPLVWPN